MNAVKTRVDNCRLIDIRRYSDTRGYLSVIEGNDDIPFEIKRVYYLYMVPEVSRGAHAHKALQQLLIATSGSMHVTLDDGKKTKDICVGQALERFAGRSWNVAYVIGFFRGFGVYGACKREI